MLLGYSADVGIRKYVDNESLKGGRHLLGRPPWATQRKRLHTTAINNTNEHNKVWSYKERWGRFQITDQEEKPGSGADTVLERRHIVAELLVSCGMAQSRAKQQAVAHQVVNQVVLCTIG